MKRFFSTLLLLATIHLSFAQLVASHDTTICAGQSVQLNATGGTTYTWTPSNTLTGANTANPVAHPTDTTMYIVSSPINTADIVVNGNFSQGNTGFTSSYVYEVPTNAGGSGSYFVGGNANHWNSNMSSLCSDHTSGVDTNMMIVNGSLTAGTNVWCETLPVYPNATYNLSAWIQELHNQNYPVLQWTVNGVNVGNAQQATFFVCVWTHATATWNSGVNTSATFCIVDPDIQANGNDFALDDISITGSGTLKDTVIVNVADMPVVDLGNDTAICSGQNVLLDAGNSGASYLWNDNSTTQTLAVNITGNYSVTVNASGCTATDNINIDPLVLTVSTAVVNTTCGLSNGQASATPDNGNSPFTYLWSNNGATDTITGIPGGTYTVSVHDAAGCSAIGTAVVNTSGSGNVTITGTNTQICATDSANICAPTGYASYLWNTGAISNCIHPSNAGNYYVTVTDLGNCTAASNHVAVTVFNVPSVSVSVNGDTLSAFNASTYQWYFNGNEITGATNSTHVATQSGNYTVQVSDSNGCVAISNPLAVVVNGINDPANDVSLEVYPNPNAGGSWQLAVGNALVGKELEVIDVTGKIIAKRQIEKNKEQVELRVSSGVYLLKVTAGEKTYLKNLVKQ